ncbi:MAG: biotin synthase BioB [Gammaproteobacteria bacterium]|nr:biotin synthase BioB [Gammaproteobacteria bacterium]
MDIQMAKHDWQLDEVKELFNLPFADLIYQAQTAHRQNFDPNTVQLSTLLSIKTGGCPEDCKYCPQSIHYDTGLNPDPLMPLDDVLAAARNAKAGGATRFCMGAAWRSPTYSQVNQVANLISAVKDEGLETCVTLGMLDEVKTQTLAEAGLEYYNHNLDTSPDYYGDIITTRTYQDRLDTLRHVRDAGIKVCCGGIVGMGESRKDRAGLLAQLANLPEHPESVPINMLVRVEGTPASEWEGISQIEFIRTVAVARIMMPSSFVRLSAGRTEMTLEGQALCFLAGANSIFCGDKLLTTPNPEKNEDMQLFEELGITPSVA